MAAKITFAIPFYSTPEYLDAAVRSVISQTCQDWELVVVDDQSPHKSIEQQLKSYNDSRIKYFLNPQNLGQSGNWNQCLKLATSDLVCILHADDELLPNYADLMLSAAACNPDINAFFCKARIIDGYGREVFSFADFYKKFIMPASNSNFKLQGEAGLSALLRGNFIMAPTLCYRKNNLLNTWFSPDWKCAPDLDFTSRLLMAGGKLLGLPEVAFRYRRHEVSGTAIYRKSLAQFEEEIRLYNKIAEGAAKLDWTHAAKAAQSKLIVKMRLLYFGLKDLFLLRGAAAWDKFNLMARLLAVRG